MMRRAGLSSGIRITQATLRAPNRVRQVIEMRSLNVSLSELLLALLGEHAVSFDGKTSFLGF